MKIKKALNFLIWALFIVFALIFIIQIILKLTSHSPTDIQILYIGFGVMMTYLLAMSYKMGIFVGEVKHFMKETKEFMDKTENSINKIKVSLSKIEK